MASLIKRRSLEITDFHDVNGWNKKVLVVGDDAEPSLWCNAYLATCDGLRASTQSSCYPRSVIRRHPDGFRILRVLGLGTVEFDVQGKTILGKCSHLFWRRDVEFWWQRHEAKAALLRGMASASLEDWCALADLMTEELGAQRCWVYSTEHAAQTIQQLLPGLGVTTMRELVGAVTCVPLRHSEAVRRTASETSARRLDRATIEGGGLLIPRLPRANAGQSWRVRFCYSPDSAKSLTWKA